jgi:hypothetical protein
MDGTPQRTGKKTFLNVTTQQTHYATNYANENNTGLAISSFAHGMPKRTPRDQRNVTYAYNDNPNLRTSPIKNTPRTYIDARSFTSKPEVTKVERQYMMEVDYVGDSLDGYMNKVYEFIKDYDIAVATKRLGRNRASFSERAWHWCNKLTQLNTQFCRIQVDQEDHVYWRKYIDIGNCIKTLLNKIQTMDLQQKSEVFSPQSASHKSYPQEKDGYGRQYHNKITESFKRVSTNSRVMDDGERYFLA